MKIIQIYKLIFFIFDESSAYLESDISVDKKSIKIDQPFWGRPHLYFLDKRFINTIKNSGADYVVWFAPYKVCRQFDQTNIPFLKGAVIDVNSIDMNDKSLLSYNEDLIISSEV